ncbi:ABC transporter permease [Xylanibacillus composti]|uniref:ABC-2 type transporter transmembrane domain-containing protein n=1 Tax=Xylanibacillus composti TaxID=1572762 RepID=A0A8J4H1G4_9BACL|nr:ABC transporter permease [Xylanibacillus composti]MDT9723965.1 ABC transporter permease [Xylanibacillus composti]GIQ67846.1 hypothetical protein XYCOK13_06700 [Xylanibacillus composti]
MNKFWTVLAFTVANKFRTKSFVVTSLIIAIVISIGLNAPYFISKFQTDETVNVGVIEGSSEMLPLLDQHVGGQERAGLELVVVPDQGSLEDNERVLKERIAAGEIAGYLLFGEADANGFPMMTYKSEKAMDFGTVNQLQQALQAIKVQVVAPALGLTAEQVNQINAPIALNKVQISVGEGAGNVGDAGKTEGEIAVATGFVYVMVIVLFIGVMASGQLIATEITAEKSSRVMEILVTSVSPLKQMFGKIFGMFIVGISQLLLLGAVALANIALPHNRSLFADMNIDLSSVGFLLIFYAVLFYLMGYFLYAAMFAAVGSIVSRTEDLGQAIMPVTFLSMIGYFIAIFGISAPDSTLITVTSFIPFFSPFIMFLRVGLTDPAVWEVWLAIGLLAATIFVTGWLAAKIYRTGVLMYGKRPSLKELRRAMRAYKI